MLLSNILRERPRHWDGSLTSFMLLVQFWMVVHPCSLMDRRAVLKPGCVDFRPRWEHADLGIVTVASDWSGHEYTRLARNLPSDLCVTWLGGFQIAAVKHLCLHVPYMLDPLMVCVMDSSVGKARTFHAGGNNGFWRKLPFGGSHSACILIVVEGA